MHSRKLDERAVKSNTYGVYLKEFGQGGGGGGRLNLFFESEFVIFSFWGV